MGDDLQRGLEQEAQYKTERMPPEMAKVTEVNNLIGELIEKLRRFMADNKFSQSQIAKMIGVSATQVNLFLAGKYGGDLESLARKLVSLMDTYERRKRRPRGQGFVETAVARRIATLIINTQSFSDVEGKLGLIIGDGGHGKSCCLRQYVEANPNSVVIELDDCMSTRHIFAAIATVLHLDGSGSLPSITRRIIDNLQNRSMVVILDEASSLTVRQLNQLRQIVLVKGRCPLVLAGNQGLLKTIMQTSEAHGKESLDQVTSRLMAILNLDELADRKDGGDGGLYTAEDVRKLYTYGGIGLASSGVAALRKICQTPRSGRLRTCGHIVSALHTARVAERGRAIDAELIVAAIASLDLPLAVRLPLMTRDLDEEIEAAGAAAAAG